MNVATISEETPKNKQ